MSLETIERKILSTGKLPFWKFLIFYGLLPSTITLSISYTFVPFIFAESQTLGVKILALLSLSAFYMIVSFIVILISVGILRGLSKLSNCVTYRAGIFTGHSLATNDEFLGSFAKGVFLKLIGFIQGYNDPKFETLETKYERHHNERMENERLYLNDKNRLEDNIRKDNFILRAQNKNKDRKIKEQDEELKIWKKVASDVSFRTIRQQKELDKFQTRLDEF